MTDRTDSADQTGRDTGEAAADASPLGNAPPSAGTGERSNQTNMPPAGRVDAERATWGAVRRPAGDVAEGAPPENVGGAQASTADDAVVDQPVDDAAERPGYREPHEGDRRP